MIEEGDQKGATYPATYIIDKNGALRFIQIQDIPIGRSVDEILRLVQAIQYADDNKVLIPSKWRPGGKTLVPDHSSNKVQEYWITEHVRKD